MVSSKFLFDDGESDEVYIDEWAASGGVTVKELIAMERDFLKAIVSILTFTPLNHHKNHHFLRTGISMWGN